MHESIGALWPAHRNLQLERANERLCEVHKKAEVKKARFHNGLLVFLILAICCGLVDIVPWLYKAHNRIITEGVFEAGKEYQQMRDLPLLTKIEKDCKQITPRTRWKRAKAHSSWANMKWQQGVYK
jgi:hypothetical protein